MYILHVTVRLQITNNNPFGMIKQFYLTNRWDTNNYFQFETVCTQE